MSGIHLYESKHRESYEVNIHHHSNYQILYAIEGEGSIQLDGVKHAVEQECAAIIFPHSDHAVSSESHLTLLVMEFDVALMQDAFASRWKADMIDGSILLRLNSVSGNELRQLLRKLLFEQKQEDSLSQWAMQIHLLEVLLLLARAKQSAQVTDANGLRAERIRSYIDSHYFEPLMPGELAQRLGISSRHAAHIFKEQYQLTLLQYLTEVRMSTAMKLLAESDKDIVSIGFEVGYESLPTFYRTFKNYVKLSPNKYRQQHRTPVQSV
ncbi:AraC family transcriptional regulator [Paenibacillus periandrae]|uniref:AraC family transcriptional regulator n=1 Tax=Paenibacillus periandrae TaxID=1761741 RepID=UPI001F09BE90|nr:AraC family transcriptional regulator [Paenibacillus periandrae]